MSPDKLRSGLPVTRVRRVLSAQGAVTVGYAPVHSTPVVTDNPLVILESDGHPGMPDQYLTFSMAEAVELYRSLHYVIYGEEKEANSHLGPVGPAGLGGHPVGPLDPAYPTTHGDWIKKQPMVLPAPPYSMDVEIPCEHGPSHKLTLTTLAGGGGGSAENVSSGKGGRR